MESSPRVIETDRVECRGFGYAAFLTRPLTILRGMRRRDFPADLVAGLTVAAVAIPQAIAYASIAELPPHYGLYTAAVGAVVGALWGCSRFLATGPVNAISLLVLPVLLSVAAPGTPEFLLAASLVAVMVGVLNVILSLLRFGALVTLASRSVLIGFTAGAAVHIAVGQAKHMLGLEIPALPELHRAVAALGARLGETSQLSLALGLGTLVLVVGLRHIGSRIPSALLAIVAAAVAVWLFDLEARGVRVVGAIPRSLPPPTWIGTGMLPDLHMVRGLVTGALAVAALGLIEAVAASQTLARRSGERLDANQEFFGQGLANIASGLLSGYPCSGSFTRSALAAQAGARTHLAGVITGLTVLVGMLLFAPWARQIPRAAIAGVLLVVAWRMVDREGIRRVLRTSRTESAIMVITFAATLVLPLDFAVLAGVIFSLAFFVIRSSLPRVVPVVPDTTFRHFVHDPERPACPQLGIFNIRGPLFFGAVHHVEEELRHNRETHPGQNHLVLRLHGVDICDLSGVEMLESTVRDYRQTSGDVYIVRPRHPMRKVLEQSGFLDETLGRDHVLEQEGAIEFLFDEVLDPAVCIYECEHRVFAECQALEKHQYGVRVPPPPRHPHAHERMVSPVRFQELASDPEALVLDVREPAEYGRGHIPGATLLPLRLLAEKAETLPRNRTLLLACRSGRRGSRALHMLEDLGFTRHWGLRGGILAWRAEGLPETGPGEGEDTREAAGPGIDEPGSDRQRRVLAGLSLKRRVEQLEERLHALSTTQDLSEIRGALERLLDRPSSLHPREEAVITLDPERPVLVVSDSHALRIVFHKLLLDKYTGGGTNLEGVVRGHLQLVLLGDLLHSENRNRWQAIEDEYVTQFASEGDEVGPTPSLDREMADAFGLAAMIMALQREAPGIHCLKGNHDNLLNAEGGGNGQILKHVPWPGEGAIARAWTLVRLGASFAGKYAAWESRLPIFAIYHARPGGLGFVASHTEPARAYRLREIEARGDEVVFGLTWTRNEGRFAPEVLREVFGKEWMQARYFVSHTGSEEGIIHVPRNQLVVVNKPRHLVSVLVRPDAKDFEVHIVADV